MAASPMATYGPYPDAQQSSSTCYVTVLYDLASNNIEL
jgi:hypothetical protein